MIEQVHKPGKETAFPNGFWRHAIFKEEHSCPHPKSELHITTSFQTRALSKGVEEHVYRGWIWQTLPHPGRGANQQWWIGSVLCALDRMWWKWQCVSWSSSPNPKPQSNHEENIRPIPVGGTLAKYRTSTPQNYHSFQKHTKSRSCHSPEEPSETAAKCVWRPGWNPGLERGR